MRFLDDCRKWRTVDAAMFEKSEFDEPEFDRTQTHAFSDLSLAFCDELSRHLLALDGESSQAIKALGFWLRPANTRRIQVRYSGQRKGLGCVFHVPPSNVPTLAIYSWICALLAGNSNIVRLSSRSSGAVEQILMAQVASVLTMDRFQALKKRNRFERYGHDDKTTLKWLSQADAAMFWGSDPTVAHLSGLCLKTDNELGRFTQVLSFPARSSVMLVDLFKSESDINEALVDRVWRDTHPFYQQACSSPKGIVWLGSSERIARQRALFWQRYAERLKTEYAGSPEWLVWGTEQAVYLQTLSVIQKEILQFERNRYLSIKVPAITLDNLSIHPGCFSFLEMECDHFKTVFARLKIPIQTLTVWPRVDDAERDALLANNVLRIVSVGQALDFDVVWDGKDIIQTLSVINTAERLER